MRGGITKRTKRGELEVFRGGITQRGDLERLRGGITKQTKRGELEVFRGGITKRGNPEVLRDNTEGRPGGVERRYNKEK